MGFLLNEKILPMVKLSEKFLARQAKQVSQYGAKNKVCRVGVSDEMLNVFTPFRRTSNKPCMLSDNKWFIKHFEQTRGRAYLPQNWSTLSEAEKVDYIVKDRYQSLVGNKIMNVIKDEPVEHSFGISKNGEIIFHDFGEISKAETKQFNNYLDFQSCLKAANIKSIECADIGMHIHNHPDFHGVHVKDTTAVGSSFSGNDMYNFMLFDVQGRVVDSLGHKFSFIPKKKNAKDHSVAESIMRYFNNIWDNKIFAKKEVEELVSKNKQKLDEYETYLKIPNYNLEHAKQLKKEFMATRGQIEILSKPLEEQKNLFGNDATIKEYFGKWDCIS